MTYTVHVNIMPLKELLDPQGKAVLNGLSHLSINAIEDVRIGKRVSLKVQADHPTQAKEVAEIAAKKLLANAVMEYFEIEVEA